jgi:hypothetical protein
MQFKNIYALLLLLPALIHSATNPASAFANFTFYNNTPSTLTVTLMWTRCSTPNLPKKVTLGTNKSQSISFDKSCSFSYSATDGKRSINNQSSKNQSGAYVYLPSYVGAQDTGSNLVVMNTLYKK